MTERPTPPNRWPRYLSRKLAAEYCGVSESTFDWEVAHGIWPQGERRGRKGGRLTWDKELIDRRGDIRSGLSSEAGESGLGGIEWGKSA